MKQDLSVLSDANLLYWLAGSLEAMGDKASCIFAIAVAGIAFTEPKEGDCAGSEHFLFQSIQKMEEDSRDFYRARDLIAELQKRTERRESGEVGTARRVSRTEADHAA